MTEKVSSPSRCDDAIERLRQFAKARKPLDGDLIYSCSSRAGEGELRLSDLEALLVISETNAHRELIRDASRYRWLREAKFLEIVTDNQMFRVAGGDNLDKTIDVAATP